MTGEGEQSKSNEPESGTKHSAVVRNSEVRAEKAALARSLRRSETEAEQQVWKLLRNRGCRGLKFRRQQVIRGYIVDFYCAELRLALEIDGPVHEARQDYDQTRDQALAQAGITVVRIQNDRITQEYVTEILASLPVSSHGEGAGG